MDDYLAKRIQKRWNQAYSAQTETDHFLRRLGGKQHEGHGAIGFFHHK